MKKKYKIFTKEGELDSINVKSSVIALGTFDGVHIAHTALLSKTAMLARVLSADAAGAWCFEEPPASFFSKKGIPALCPCKDRVMAMLDCGLDFVITSRFEDFMELSAEDFINNILKKDLKCIGTVCGFNHRFGNGGRGDYELLKSFFGEGNTIKVPQMQCANETVSSTRIREYISCGSIGAANKMLGRNYFISSPVISGKKLGRTIGFPTANQKFDERYAIPKFGIYASRCTLPNGECYIGVSNVGIRPTIESDDHIPNCETYLIGFSGDLYGVDMKTEFCSFLREEKKFSSLDELSAAIREDADAAIKFFNGK